MRNAILLLIGLILLTAAVYWPVSRFPFIAFDDGDYVYANPHLATGFSAEGFHFAFTSFRMGNWNPLLWYSFYIDELLFHHRPGPMHVENVLLHLCTGILIWRLLVISTRSVYRSWIVAALFLVHPMHVESVAWIAERKDVLSTPLLIGAMIAYVHFAKTSSYRAAWYVLMILLFAMSLMAKSMGVTLPAVLLLCDFWPLRRWRAPALRGNHWLVIEKIPLLLMSLGASILGTISQTRVGSTAGLSGLGIIDRISNAAVCYVLYIAKLLVPTNLAVFYPLPASRPVGAVFASGVLLLLITVLFIRIRKRSPFAIMGWLWFLGTLIPVIGLVQIGAQSMADRYSYFPSVGMLIVLVWGSHDLLGRVVKSFSFRCGFTAGVTVLFTILGHVQLCYWKDTKTLFTHTLEVTDDNTIAHVVLGQLCLGQNDSKGAIDHFMAAIKYRRNARAYYALGNAWAIDNPTKAANYFRQATELQPQNFEFHLYYAKACRVLGDFQTAIEQAELALQIDPTDPGAREELDKAKQKLTSR